MNVLPKQMAVARYRDYACKQGGKLMIVGDNSLQPLSASEKKKNNRTSQGKHMLESIGTGKCFKTSI